MTLKGTKQPSEYNRRGVTAFADRAVVDSFLASVATTAVMLLLRDWTQEAHCASGALFHLPLCEPAFA